MIRNVLVVCEGNVCRSPMAQVLLARDLPAVTVTSAGTGALVGRGADPLAIALLEKRGLALDQHIARSVDQGLVAGADLILAMTGQQREFIARTYPFSTGRVYRLLDQYDEDVTDPYRLGESAFCASLAQIDKGVLSWQTRISRINGR